MRQSSRMRRAACAVLGALACAPAAAKVVFTGYADFATTPQGSFKIDGPPSVLSGFGVGPEKIETRGSGINALGLFASTSLSDDAHLQMDVTYRNIGATAKTISIQYAYLEYSAYDGQARVGKITLPFGWYNQNRFYPFQRPSISAPLFQSAILGLPIADIGAAAGRPFELGPLTATADVYAVNGYGPVPGSTTTFRSATLPGGLTIANNLGSADANHKVAAGARLDFAHKDFKDSNAGVSYYRGEWDPAGRKLFQMAGAHLRASAAGFEFIGEYLALSVKGDQGLEANLGSPDWRTDGFFAELDYHRLSVRDKTVTPWIRFEDYFSRAQGGGGGREAVWEAAGGTSVQLIDGVLAKFEAADLYYRLPFQGKGDLTLMGYVLQLGLTVTF